MRFSRVFCFLEQKVEIDDLYDFKKIYTRDGMLTFYFFQFRQDRNRNTIMMKLILKVTNILICFL